MSIMATAVGLEGTSRKQLAVDLEPVEMKLSQPPKRRPAGAKSSIARRTPAACRESRSPTACRARRSSRPTRSARRRNSGSSSRRSGILASSRCASGAELVRRDVETHVRPRNGGAPLARLPGSARATQSASSSPIELSSAASMLHQQAERPPGAASGSESPAPPTAAVHGEIPDRLVVQDELVLGERPAQLRREAAWRAPKVLSAGETHTGLRRGTLRRTSPRRRDNSASASVASSGYARRRRCRRLRGADHERLAERSEQVAGDDAADRVARDVGQQHQELVAAVAAEHVGRAQIRAAVGDLGQQPIRRRRGRAGRRRKLKSSRSANISATAWPLRSARASAAISRRSIWLRLGRPVSGSW